MGAFDENNNLIIFDQIALKIYLTAVSSSLLLYFVPSYFEMIIEVL